MLAEYSRIANGMFGKSWGGFNSLQVAARQPPALKAIISVYSTDDRYADDIHYRGGCVMGSSALSWASVMALWNARPPEPLSVGKSWKQLWLNRLQHASEPWIHKWLSHQSRDQYWKHGSVCKDYAKITCPVLLIGAWADLYTNTVFRMAQNLSCPVRAIIGPWSHCWPGQGGNPGPDIDHVDVFLRWFSCHLKGIDNGIMSEPKMVIYMKDGLKMPSSLSDIKTWPGKWVCEENWPSANVVDNKYTLDMNKQELLPIATSNYSNGAPRNGTSRKICGNPACGIYGGIIMATGSDDMPLDQARDDMVSLCWESSLLSEPFSVLGFPVVSLQLSCDQCSGIVAVRLCDVFPDGSSTLITRGLLNLTHRNGHDPESLANLVPGKVYNITVQLDAVGYVVAADHKIRLAVSPTYWPTVWPSAVPTCLTVYAGELSLPVRVANVHTQQLDGQMCPFKPHEILSHAQDNELKSSEPDKRHRIIEVDPQTKLYKLTVINNKWTLYLRDTGTFREESCTEVYSMTDTANHGYQPMVSIRKSLVMHKDGFPQSDVYKQMMADQEQTQEEFFAWNTRITHDSDMWSDDTHFHVRNKLTCYHGDEVVFDKTWEKAIKRDRV